MVVVVVVVYDPLSEWARWDVYRVLWDRAHGSEGEEEEEEEEEEEPLTNTAAENRESEFSDSRLKR